MAAAIRLLNEIEAKTGIVLKDNRLQRIQAFLDKTFADRTSEARLLNAVEKEPLTSPLWQEIIEQITVGETYFFRNHTHFDVLRSDIFTSLIRARQRENKPYLRIWVAGCATGEEPYSIAMLLKELLPNPQSWSIFLLATDINEAFLSFAKVARYRERAFRNETPDYVQARWFRKVGQHYELLPEIRQMVTFNHLNLIDGNYPSLANNTMALDVILCRNVTIYFDRATTQSIVNRFYEALLPGGHLFIGHSEPQPGVYDAFEVNSRRGAIFYRKPLEKPVVMAKAVPPPVPVAVQPTNGTRPSTSKVIETSPPERVAESPLVLAQRAADVEDWDTALGLLDKMELDNRFNPMVHYLRGLVLTHMDNVDGAVKAFRQATYCEPGFALAHYALGELQERAGSHKEAVASWKRAYRVTQNQAADDAVMGADDLTVEMLRDLLSYRLR